MVVQRCQPLEIQNLETLYFALQPPPPPNVNSPNIPHPPCPENDPAAMAKEIIWSLTWSTWRNNLCQRLNMGKNVLEIVQWIKFELWKT